MIVAELLETPQSTFETSSKDLINGLLILGHRPYRIEAEGRVLFYKFDKALVTGDVNRILTGDDLRVSYHKSIAANTLWAMNLTRANELLNYA